MAQFEQRINEIGAAIADLVSAVRSADQEVGQLDQRFDQLIRNANTVTDLARAVEQLDKALSAIGDGAGLAALQSRLRSVAAEIRELDGTKIARLADSLQKQQQLIESLGNSQVKIAQAASASENAFRKTRLELSGLVAKLGEADVKLGEFSSKLLSDLSESATNARDIIKIVDRISEASQRLNPDAWAQTAQGFNRLASAINKIELHKLEAIRDISVAGAPITVNMGAKQGGDGATQRAATPTPKQTASTTRGNETTTVVDADTGKTTTSEAATSAGVVKEKPPQRVMVPGESNQQLRILNDTMRKLIASDDIMMDRLRQEIFKATAREGEQYDPQRMGMFLEKVYDQFFRQELGSKNTYADLAKQLGPQFDGLVRGYAQALERIYTESGPSENRTMAPPIQERMQQALDRLYQAPDPFGEGGRLREVYDARRFHAELGVGFTKEAQSGVLGASAQSAMKDFIARGGDIKKLPETLQGFEQAALEAKRYVDHKLKGKRFDIGDENQVLGTTKGLQDYLSQAESSQKPQAFISGETRQFAVDTYKSMRGQLTNLLAQVSASGKGSLAHALPHIMERVDALRNNVNSVISTLEELPASLKHLFLDLQRSIEEAHQAIKAAHKSMVDTAGVFQLQDRDSDQLKQFAKNALGGVLFENVVQGGRNIPGFVGDTSGVQKNTWNQGTGGVYYQETDLEDHQERGKHYEAEIRRLMEDSGTSIAYLASGGRGHVGSSTADVADGLKHRVDHALLAYIDKVTGDLHVLDQNPGKIALGERLGLSTPLLNSVGGGSVAGWRGDIGDQLGKYDSLSVVPMNVDDDTAARMAAEVAAVVQPNTTYSMFSEFGETCSSAIFEGFQRAGLDSQGLVKNALGGNIVTPADMLRYAQELNQKGVEPYSAEDTAAALQRFTGIQERLKNDLGNYYQKIADAFSAESGVDSESIRKRLKGEGTLSDDIESAFQTFLKDTTDVDTGRSYDVGRISYERTTAVLGSYLDKLRAKSDSVSTVQAQDATVAALNETRAALSQTDLDDQSASRLAAAMSSLETAIRQLNFNKLIGSFNRFADIFAGMADQQGDNLGSGSPSAFMSAVRKTDRSFLDSPIDVLKQISKGYGKFATISTNIGALINGTGELLRAMREPDLGTPLDFTRSGVKIFDALKNIGYQVGLSGSPANTDRSSTLVDIVHAGSRIYKDAKAGTLGRPPIRQVIEPPTVAGARTTEEERAMMATEVLTRDLLLKRGFRQPITSDQATALNEMINNMAKGQEITLQDFFKMWKDGPKAETAAKGPAILAELMESYRAELELAEAQKAVQERGPQVAEARERARKNAEARERRAAAQAAADAQQYGPSNMGAAPYLSGQGSIRAYISDEQRNLRDFLLSRLSKEDADRYNTGQSIVGRHFKGTEFEQFTTGFAVVDPNAGGDAIRDMAMRSGAERAEANNFKRYARKGYLGGMGGGQLGGLNNDQASGFAVLVDSPEHRANAASIATHELVHALTQTKSEALRVSAEMSQAMSSRIGKVELQSPSFNAFSDKYKDDARFGGLVEMIGEQPDYFYTQEELMSNAGAAHLSSDRAYENFYREAYGDKLYDDAISRLKQHFPNTFNDERVEQFRASHGEFAQGIEGLYKSEADPGIMGRFEDEFNRILSSLNQGTGILARVEKAFESLWRTVQRFLGNLGINLGGAEIDPSMGGGAAASIQHKRSNIDLQGAADAAVASLDKRLQTLLDRADSPELTDLGNKLTQVVNRTADGLENMSKANAGKLPDNPVVNQVVAGLQTLDDQIMKTVDNLDSPEVTDALTKTVQALNQSYDSLVRTRDNIVDTSARVAGALGNAWVEQQDNPIVDLAARFARDPNLLLNADPAMLRDTAIDTMMSFVGRQILGPEDPNRRPGLFDKYIPGPVQAVQAVAYNLDTDIPFTNRNVGDFLARRTGEALSPRLYGGADIEEVQSKLNQKLLQFGDAVKGDSIDVKAMYDFETGLTRIAASAETAAGQMVDFNGHIDHFGNLVEDANKKQDGFFSEIKQNFWKLPMEVMQESVEELAFGFMALVGQIVNVQDELAEVSLLLTDVNATSEEMSQAGTSFLFSSISAASNTGQQFDEGIQTNIQNLKQLAFVPDKDVRQRIAAELSTIQLGSQTAFGLTLDESLETLPAIYSQLQSSVRIPEQLAAGMTESEQATYRAEEALKRLKEVMNGLVTAQRESGANAEDLAQVYANLAGSAKDAALSQEELLSLAAVASVKLTGGADEISNAIKFIMERTYGSGAGELRALGIETTELKTDDLGRTVVAPRSFVDILAESQELRLSQPEKSKAITSALGSQRRAPQALALLEGVTEQQRITAASDQIGTGGTQFMDLVTRKSEQFGGQLNKAQSSLALFLNEVLFGSGIMDDLGGILGNVSDLLTNMATAMSDNPEIIEIIKGIGKAVLTGVVYASTRAINVLSIFAKGVNYLSNSMRSLIMIFTQIGRQGPQTFTPLQRYAQLAASTMDKLQTSSQRAFQPFLTGTKHAVKGVNQVTSSVEQLNAKLDQVQANSAEGFVGGVSPNQRGQIREFLGGLGGEKPTFWQTGRGRAIQGAGSFAGSMIAPVAFDLLAGGFDTENYAEIGLGLAGGVAGFFLGGPGGSIIGYSIAKSAADYLDITGVFGTSSTEIEKTLKAFDEAYRLTTETPTERIEREEAEARTSEAVQSFIDSTGLERVIDAAIASRDNRALFGNSQIAVSSNNLARFRSMSEGEETPWWDLQGHLFNINAGTDSTGYSAATDLQAIYDAVGSTDQPRELLDFLVNAKFSNFEELKQMLTDAADPTTEIGQQMLSIVSNIELARDAQAEFNMEIQAGGEKYIPLKSTLEDIDERLSLLKEKSRYLYAVPENLTQFGAFGSFTQSLDESYGERIAGFAEGGSQGEYKALMEQYNDQRTAALGLPSVMGLTLPLADQLGQDIDQEQLLQTLYQGGTELQNQWSGALQPMVEMLGFVQEYELLMERISAIEASPELAGGVTDELQVQYEAELATLMQKKDIQAGMYEEYKAYLALIMQEPGLLQATLQGLQQKAAVQKKVEARVVGGSAPQFRLPSGVNVEDYSTDDIAAALGAARARQADLTAMFPEAAAEFAKQQFLLESGGQVRGVTGVSSSFFQEALRDIQGEQKNLQAPNIQDFRDKSDQEIADIIARARALQGQAVDLAPDLARDLEDERLLVLRKNNELLMETGLSQEYLRLAMEDNTDATNATLRGHYNLPGSYRPPTIWDYYNEGGREAGSENFPGGPESGAMVPISFARDLANRMLQEGSEDGSGPNLDELGGLIDPNARPLGYPSPGSPGTVIMPPDLELPDGIYTTDIIVGGVSISDLLNPRYTPELPDGPLDPTIIPPDKDWRVDPEIGEPFITLPRILEPFDGSGEVQGPTLPGGDFRAPQPLPEGSYGPTLPGQGWENSAVVSQDGPDWDEALPPDSLWDKTAAQVDGFGADLGFTADTFQTATSNIKGASAEAAMGLIGITTAASAQTTAAQAFAGSVVSITKQLQTINLTQSLAQAINNGRIEIEIKSDGSRPRATVVTAPPPPAGSTKGGGGVSTGTSPTGGAKPR